MQKRHTWRGFTPISKLFPVPLTGKVHKAGKGSLTWNTPPSAVQATSCAREEVNHGFTLIELLVVVLIIGILAAIALPQYQKAVAKARAVELMTIIDACQKALVAYMLSGGPEKLFFETTYAGKITTDNRDELDIFIPISDELAKNYQWGVTASPTNWSLSSASIADDAHFDLAVEGEPLQGECAGYDQTGVTICRTLAQHYPNFTCRDASGSFNGVPPLCD